MRAYGCRPSKIIRIRNSSPDGLGLSIAITATTTLQTDRGNWAVIVEHRIVQATDVNLGDLNNTLISSGALDLGSTSLYVEATAGNINLLPTATLNSITTTGDITLIGGDIKIPAGLTSISAADLSILARGTIGSAAAAADNAGALTAAFRPHGYGGAEAGGDG